MNRTRGTPRRGRRSRRRRATSRRPTSARSTERRIPSSRADSREGAPADSVKAIRLHARGGPEQLLFEDAPEPDVRAGDVVVRVLATGITPTELRWDETYQHADGTPRIPSIPGHEVSGVVERV